jgi:hypothetical protein
VFVYLLCSLALIVSSESDRLSTFSPSNNHIQAWKESLLTEVCLVACPFSGTGETDLATRGKAGKKSSWSLKLSYIGRPSYAVGRLETFHGGVWSPRQLLTTLQHGQRPSTAGQCLNTNLSRFSMFVAVAQAMRIATARDSVSANHARWPPHVRA